MTTTTLSPYQSAGVVNTWLKDLGLEKKLPPQMFYTYTNKGYIKSEKVEGKTKVTREDLRDWFDNKYIPKNHPDKVVKSEVDENQLELDVA
jgi:hypothetical protein